MCALKIVVVLLFIGYVASEDDKTVITCYKKDLQCVSVLMRQAASGYPKFDIEPADPLLIPELIVENEGLLITLNSVNVTGLSQQNITEFLVYPDGRSEKMVFISPIEINAAFNLKAENPTKGHYYMKALISGMVGPETITGVLKNNPETKLMLNRNLKDANFKGDDKIWRKFEDALNKMVIEIVVPTSINAMMGNMAALRKVAPKTRFFYDLM